MNMAKVPIGVKITNAFRLLQYIAKIVVYIMMMRVGFDSEGAALGVLAIFQCLVLYSLWRLWFLAKRVPKYVAQWSLPVSDVVAAISIKFLYVQTFSGGYPD